MMSKALLALGALVLHAQAGATCFTLIGTDNRTVYQSMSPPFDLSRPLSQTLAARYPGHHLVMADTSDCPLIDVRPDAASSYANSGSKAVVDSAVFRNAREIGDLTEAEIRQANGALPGSRNTRSGRYR